MANLAGIEELNWAHVRDKLNQSEPLLTTIIDAWEEPSNKQFSIFKVSYPFGAKIYDNGKLQLPNANGKMVPIDDSSIPAHIQRKLNYNTLPLAFLDGKGIEVYREIPDQKDDRVFSLAFFNSGLNLGIWECFRAAAPYSVSAGARALFLVPKTNDADNFKKLYRAFNLRTHMPKNLFDQCPLYRELVEKADIQWNCDVYFLSREWLENRTSVGWKDFYIFLLERAWRHTDYARDRTIFEVSWQQFCQQLKVRGLKPDPYLVEVARHLVFVGQGMLPAFKPAGASDVAGPITELQKIYLNEYGLKNYVPTFMHPANFLSEPVYFSLPYPNILELVPKSNSYASSIDHLRAIKELWSIFLNDLTPDSLGLNIQNLLYLKNKVAFDFFHSDMHTYGGIKPTSDLPLDDPNLLLMPGGQGKRVFANKGPFIRCCIRIKKRD